MKKILTSAAEKECRFRHLHPNAVVYYVSADLARKSRGRFVLFIKIWKEKIDARCLNQ